MENGIVTEIVEFKVIDKTENKKILEVVDYVEKEFHYKQSGFIDTELVKGTQENQWYMIHHYASMKEIQEVGKKMSSSGMLKVLSEIINMDSVKISLLEQYKYWKKE